ncbi:Nudix hydrolase domain-containing protein [Meloidogyne graminicola]|uniref:Nudix hydrolase domain-containing protein n=1 Tax=Meloidogyne graminicola TaxID=189291 RepID=A0A8S9ZSL2_9BILA|nr:Nudix hydrolase domain-containing protein [Meloidogyne graminicola]
MSNKICCRMLHIKCRNSTKPYSRSNIYRVRVKDNQVSWDSDFGECSYSPKDYTASTIIGRPWADHEDPCFYTFNQIDDAGIDRRSFHGVYSLDQSGRPLNPFGRTGLRGRGVLGKWGPNHASDAIVSRFIGGDDGKQMLQFVAIVRNDTDDLAIPGGMINIGEDPRQASIREFCEEALSDRILDNNLSSLWDTGKVVYQGYIDDPRNTDNSWMETSCFNFHDSDGLFRKCGSDAKSVKWVTVTKGLELYASHKHLVKLFAKMYDVDID